MNWDEVVAADEEMLAKAKEAALAGLSRVPVPVRQAGGAAMHALNMPLTGVGGLIGLAQGRSMQEAAQGIEEGKTAGNYLTEAIPEPTHESMTMNALQELARQGSGLATDLGLGMVGPIEAGQAAMKGARYVAPKLAAANEALGEVGALRIGAGTPQAASPWYSRIDEAVEKMPEKIDPGQIRNTLATLPKEEAQVRGINEYLEGKFGPIPKAEVQGFLKDNPVTLNERVLGGVKKGERPEVFDQDIWEAMESDTYKPPRFNKPGLVTPGGENYREVLIKLPSTKRLNTAAEAEERIRLGLKGKLTPAEKARYSELSAIEIAPKTDFKSSHYPDDPNLLAHLRLKDFTDPSTGKKTLLVDEIQSDWHQKGRKQGYQGAEKPLYNEAEKEIDQIIKGGIERRGDTFGIDYDGIRFSDYSEESLRNQLANHIVDKKRLAIGLSGSPVPDAPFKKNWHELAFKRALREAVEGGYDEMAWTTGAQQADRYDLAKQIDSVKWEAPMGRRDRYVLSAVKGGREVIPRGSYSADELSDVIGKDMAQKVIDQQASGKLGGEFSGLDLKVGGEGMKGFYDEMLPSYANKYLKKYGVKVEDSFLDLPDPESSGWSGLPDQEAIEAGGYTVHSIVITPEMKADILGKGQPMWQVPAAIGAGGAGAALSADEDKALRDLAARL